MADCPVIHKQLSIQVSCCRLWSMLLEVLELYLEMARMQAYLSVVFPGLGRPLCSPMLLGGPPGLLLEEGSILGLAGPPNMLLGGLPGSITEALEGAAILHRWCSLACTCTAVQLHCNFFGKTNMTKAVSCTAACQQCNNRSCCDQHKVRLLG